MKTEYASTLLFAGSAIEIFVGMIHFVWAPYLVGYGEFGGLSAKFSSLVTLSSIAIGLCVLLFGCLSMYFSKVATIYPKPTVIFCLSQVLLWVGRTILEVVFPVQIPIFLIEKPTLFIIFGGLLTSVIFLIPIILLQNHKNR